MSHVTRKPVFGVSDQVWLKPACSTSEVIWSLEILDLARIDIILSRQRTIKALIRLRGCAGWSAPFLFAYCINRFSHDVAHIRIMLLQRSYDTSETNWSVSTKRGRASSRCPFQDKQMSRKNNQIQFYHCVPSWLICMHNWLTAQK